MGEKSARNLVAAIEGSKSRPLARLLFALGIRHVGEHAARVLARRYPSLDALMAADEAELTGIHEVGPVMAASLMAFFADENNRAVVEALRAAGVPLSDAGAGAGEEAGAAASAAPGAAAIPPNPAIEGKSFVLTGTLGGMTRDEAAGAIEARGGRVVASVTSRTDFLVAGEKPGSNSPRRASWGSRC